MAARVQIREQNPLFDEVGTGIEHFVARLAHHLEREPSSIIVDLDREASLGVVAPFLAAAAAAHRQRDLPGLLALSLDRAEEPPPPSTPRKGAPREGHGSLAPEIIQKVVRASFSEIRACYDTVLRHDRKAAGRLEMRFLIADTRRVPTVGVRKTTGSLPMTMALCVPAIFASLRFPSLSSPGDRGRRHARVEHFCRYLRPRVSRRRTGALPLQATRPRVKHGVAFAMLLVCTHR